MNSRIVVEYILKFIEMVLKCEIDFEISEFYSSRTFRKSWKFLFIPDISLDLLKKLGFFLIIKEGRSPAFQVSRAVTRLTVHRSFP